MKYFQEMVDCIYKVFPKKKALTYLIEGKQAHINYTELQQFSERIHTVLQENGIQQHTPVAVLLPLSAYSVGLNFALAYYEYPSVQLDPTLPIEELNELILFSKPAVIFTIESLYYTLSQDITSSIPVMEIKDRYHIETLNTTNEKGPKEQEPEDLISVIFSSGTTGTVKGVKVTYHSIIKAFEYMQEYTGLTHKATFLDVLPSNHIAGYSAAMSCLLCGAEIMFINDISAQSLIEGSTFQTRRRQHKGLRNYG